GGDTGRVTGAIYGSNTNGAIAGALIARFLLISVFGTYPSQRILMGVCAVAGVMILFVLMPDRKVGPHVREQPLSARFAMTYVRYAVVIAAALIWAVPGPV